MGKDERPFEVVLVEDHADTRDMMQEALSASGLLVRAFAGARAALASIHTSVPDAVVTDLHMPGVSGLDLVRALRSDARTATLTVVALSGSADLGGPSEEKLFDGVLRKPVDPLGVAGELRRIASMRERA